jgi:hypothetical protein
MPEDLIMRGQNTSPTRTAKLNFTGRTPGYGYQITEFVLYPSTNIGDTAQEFCGALTASSTLEDASNPNFDNHGLIATFAGQATAQKDSMPGGYAVLNELFVITQDLLLNTFSPEGVSVNWQCRFKKVKLSSSAEAVANFNQYSLYNTEFQP